ncbi:OsmC family protein [Rhizobium bangladeshense]|uniref:OsmC family protein n=1 Tax=Rhizobium bangladeshense TaxID=1138189 RepID=UPI0009EE7D6C|nr:OsmC family protein [Rhizobium bangladeshense]
MQHVHTATRETIGSRENGFARSSDGALDIRLSNPAGNRLGTNPEQLVAIAWSVSFASSLKHVADLRRVKLHSDLRIYANVDLSSDDQGYVVGVRLDIYPRTGSRHCIALIEAVRLECPYCRATRGNIHALYNLV